MRWEGGEVGCEVGGWGGGRWEGGEGRWEGGEGEVGGWGGELGRWGGGRVGGEVRGWMVRCDGRVGR